ncbi:MAG: hypothetical protein WBC05_04980, partial [Sedimentisphaerales bacterium]
MREKHVHAMIVASVFLFMLSINASVAVCEHNPFVLKADSFEHYVDEFNKNDEELYVRHISNEHAWEFLKANIPLLECPDNDIERTYYFRWWTYRKHINYTPDGFVITEFLPGVP